MTPAARSLNPALKLGWFSTGRGEGSMGLLNAALEAIDSGLLRATIEFVFCNREQGEAEGSDAFIARVRARRIPLITFSSRKFREGHGRRPWSELRRPFDLAALELLNGYRADASVAAGYMLIAPELCKLYRMINLHPALPDGPIGTWQQVIWELIEKRAAASGAMVNVVTEEVDAGPVLSFCRFPIRGPDFDGLWSQSSSTPLEELKSLGESQPLFAAIRRAGLLRERPLLVSTLVELAGRRLLLTHPPANPTDLTRSVEAAIGK